MQVYVWWSFMYEQRGWLSTFESNGGYNTDIFSHLMLQSFRQLVLIFYLVEQAYARLSHSQNSPLELNLRYLNLVHLFILHFYIHAYTFFWNRAREPVARVPKITLGNISLARGIQRSPNFLF
jgi:hypothetical protein